MSLDLNLIIGALSALLFIAVLGFFGYLIRHQEQVEPSAEPETYGVKLLEQHYEPGETLEQPTPYFVAPIPASPDPLEISSNLDKKILLSAGTILATLGLVGGYFLIQGDSIVPSPLRPGGLRAAAVEHQLSLDVRRGKEIYASLCYDCHGRDGKAGKNPEGETLPGLPLNQAGNKHETLAGDPAALSSRRRTLEQTVERGRDKPPGQYDMPAWGRTEGGQLSPWQIKQVVDLIMYGSDEDWADIAHIRQEHDVDHRLAERIPPPPPVPSGREVAIAYCTSCHALNPGQASTLQAAPNLGDWIAAGSKPRAENPPLVALASSDPDWLRKWVSNARKIKPDTLMTPQAATEGGPLTEELLSAVLKFLRGEEK